MRSMWNKIESKTLRKMKHWCNWEKNAMPWWKKINWLSFISIIWLFWKRPWQINLWNTTNSLRMLRNILSKWTAWQWVSWLLFNLKNVKTVSAHFIDPCQSNCIKNDQSKCSGLRLRDTNSSLMWEWLESLEGLSGLLDSFLSFSFSIL